MEINIAFLSVLALAALILSALSVILLIAVLVKVRRGGDSEKLISRLAVFSSQLDRQQTLLSDESERGRREQRQFQTEMRREIAETLSRMMEKIEAMNSAGLESRQKLLETVTSSLDNIRKTNAEQNERQSRMLTEAIFRMQESNEKKLDQMRATVDEKLTSTLTTRLDSSFKTVSDQLENVYKSLGEMKELSSGVTDNVTTLNRVLTNVKARGTWAEVQLGNILDQTIPNMYVRNFSAYPGSKERVEFAIRIPSGSGEDHDAYLPVDSKFPMEDYIRFCDAADSGVAGAVSAARKSLEASVLTAAKSITKYINVPVTTPFAIMYLATEGLYAEIASSRSGISEKIQSELNVMIAGPTTITALLNSLSMGFRAVAINEKANEVRRLLAAARQQYAKFGDVLEKARRKIDEAGKTLDDAQHRNRIINDRLKGVAEIDAAEAEKTLGIFEDDSCINS